MPWLLLDIFASVIFIQTMRWSQHARGHMGWAAFVNYLFAALFYLPLFRPAAEHGLVVTGFGAMVGMMYALNFFLATEVIRTSGVALASATMALATAVPVVVSIAGGEAWGDRAPGLAVAVVAAPLLILGRNVTEGALQPPFHWRGTLRIVALLTSVGTQMSLFKVASHLGGPGFERAFLPALFTAATLASCLPALVAGRAACRRGDLLRGLLLGTCNITANYALARALLEIPGVVAFPVRLIAGVVCATVLGYILWRERVSRMGLVGIALGLTAAVLLSTAGDGPAATGADP